MQLGGFAKFIHHHVPQTETQTDGWTALLQIIPLAETQFLEKEMLSEI